SGPGSVRQDREEPMETVEREKLLQEGTLEHTQTTAGIDEINPQNKLARATGHPGRNAADEVILALGADPANKVIAFQFSEQSRKIGRVVLTVPIHGGDYRCSAGLDPSPKGGALATVLDMAQPAHACIVAMGLLDPAPSGVSAGVINENEFVR